MKTPVEVDADITALIKSRASFLWIVSTEESRVERAIIGAAAKASARVRWWDSADGLREYAPTENPNDPQVEVKVKNIGGDPNQVLTFIQEDKTRCVYVLRDMHSWLDPGMRRVLKNTVRKVQAAPSKEARTIIVLTSSKEIPPEIQPTVLEYPRPTREDIGRILDDVLSVVSPAQQESIKATLDRFGAIDAVVGLTYDQISNCFAKSIATVKRIDPKILTTEKKRLIEKDKVLQWYDPDPRGFDSVGGLDLLKPWAKQRLGAFSEEARTYGLPAPKGVFVVGISGCGKSQFAKALGAGFGMPLLRIDLGGLKSKYVGESEDNLRRALALADTVSPCVLWFDEIEKALAGSSGPQGDGGVSTDALGTILTWMQERTSRVFVVATANDVRALPPELLRKGRFDDIFFVDLPNRVERAEILKVTLKGFGRDIEGIDTATVVEATANFTGAEVAAIVPDAMFRAFADGARPITTSDLVAVAATVAPLANTAEEKIKDLREWSRGKTRPASTVDVGRANNAQRGGIDLD